MTGREEIRRLGATGLNRVSCYRVLMVTLVVMVTTVCRLSACDFGGHVNKTSHKLFLTCHCNTSDPDLRIKRLQRLRINQESHDYQKKIHLASLDMKKNETSKYAKNFTISVAIFSTDRTSAEFTLLFDLYEKHRHRQTLDFECVALGFSSDHSVKSQSYTFNYKPSVYYSTTTTTTTTTATTTTTSQPATTTMAKKGGLERKQRNRAGEEIKPEISSKMLTLIVTFSLLLIIVGLFVFIIARRRRQNPAPTYPLLPSRYPDDPLDLVRLMLEAVTSHDHRGPRHATPSCSFNLTDQSDFSAPSGSYALCDTPSLSIYSLDHPPLQNNDVTMTDMSPDVSGHVTPRNVLVGESDVEYANQNCFSPEQGPRHSEQQFSQETNMNRELLPFPPSGCPPLARSTRDQNSRPFSPLNVQMLSATSRNERHPLTPPSTALRLLPMAPSPPRDFQRTHSVPGDQEEQEEWEEWVQLSESESGGSSWEDGEITPPETVSEIESGAHKLHHLDELDISRDKLNDDPVGLGDEGVRLNEGPVRLNLNPVIIQRGRVNLSNQHNDPTYLTQV